jgi:hypothetical protein
LSLRDKLWLAFDTPLEFPLPGSTANLIHSQADYREAWLANRAYFLDGGFQPHDRPAPYDSYMRYEPCRRPIGYWLFDLGYQEIPENQIEALRHLGELAPAEFAAAQRLAKEFPSHYTSAELKTLREDEK